MVSDALRGVFRSLELYQGRAAPRAYMDALYARFVKPGDLVFDIGAHVGDRVSSFRRLGANVVAVEPQPLLLRALRAIHGRDARVTLIPCALAAAEGSRTLFINSNNPTVSTLSAEFVSEARTSEGWQGQAWDTSTTVRAITLDALIAAFGTPAFVKIDVEGYEDQVLLGLSHAVPALSFEFTTIARAAAHRCLDRLDAIGHYQFDLAIGESQQLSLGRWVDAAEMAAHLEHMPHAANSGDVYAVRVSDA